MTDAEIRAARPKLPSEGASWNAKAGLWEARAAVQTNHRRHPRVIGTAQTLGGAVKLYMDFLRA